jgi:Uma2 family endonuclease
MTAEPQRRLSADDYLALERASETRSEYLDGEVFAMAGASREHNLIATNVVGTLHPQLKARGCEKYAGDMRVPPRPASTPTRTWSWSAGSPASRTRSATPS